MAATTTTTTTTYDDLRQQVLDGDTTVTATQLERAREAAALADLQAQGAAIAAERQATEDAEAAHQAAIEQLRADIETAKTTGLLVTMQADYRQLVEAAQHLTASLVEWKEQRGKLHDRARRLGLNADVELAEIPVLERPRGWWIDRAIAESRGQRETAGNYKGQPGGYWVLHALHDDGFLRQYRQESGL